MSQEDKDFKKRLQKMQEEADKKTKDINDKYPLDWLLHMVQSIFFTLALMSNSTEQENSESNKKNENTDQKITPPLTDDEEDEQEQNNRFGI